MIGRNYEQLQRDASLHRAVERAEPALPIGREAVQTRINALREHGVTLPDVRGLREYSPRAQDGSFVHVSNETVAQHCGRGQYQLCDVARDLHGRLPPEGVPTRPDARGHVQSHEAPTLSRGNQR